ncbi:hypothetical protein EV121DRAFT_204690 [Schizophyllum commune]
MQQYRNIVVLGAAYGGQSAAKVLAEGVSKLPGNWRVVAIDRNSHLNHVYAFPRFAVVGGHEHQAFIRYDGMVPPDVSSRLLNLTAQAQSLSPHAVTLDRAFPEHGIPTPKLDFEYAIYALGSTLPAPVNLWGPRLDAKMRADPDMVETLQVGSKASGIAWLKAAQKVIRETRSVLVVGGGALGIQFATDIADVYPEKRVTLLHSRTQLLPRFSQEMHNEILRQMNRLNINVVLGERLDVQSVAEKKSSESGERVVRITSGRELAADLVLMCTGQKPNTETLRALEPTLLNEEGRVRVTRTLQLNSPAFAHMFAVGDCADAFGALCAGHNAAFQGVHAAQNLLRLIASREQPEAKHEPLESYEPHPPGIKVTLGLNRGVAQLGNDPIVINDKGEVNLQCAAMWKLFGHENVQSEEDMRA